MGSFKKILTYAKPYKKYAILNVVFNILYAVFNVLSVLGFIPVLGIIFGKEERIHEKPIYKGFSKLFDYAQDSLNYKVTNLIDVGGVEKALLFICIMSFSFFFFKNLFRYLASFVLAFLRNGVVKDLRDELYNKILDLKIAYFSSRKKGDVIARMTSDVQEVENSYLTSLETVVREPLTIVLTLISMFAISAKLTLFVFILLPVSGILISSISKKLKAKSLEAQKETGNFVSFVEETLSGLKVIKSFNAEASISSKFVASTKRFRALMMNVLHRKTLASPMSEFLGSATIILILWFGGKMVLSEDSTMQPQQFLAYIGLFYLVLNPAKAISKAFYNIQKGNASADRILEILESDDVIEDDTSATQLDSFEHDITFDNVSFKYEDDYVLKNFSLSIPKGKTVALVGQSGSGKSTIANLITRFYDVNEGSISIDGTNIKNYTKHSLREQLGMVTQEAILFHDSIAQNIAFGKNVSDEQIIDAAKIANAHEFISELPNTYETNIGDSGNKLSGGQKQRISIARAVLKNPPIMILDEATSALDTESEKLVQVALEKMMQNRTSIVIAHRLSTIQNADVIVVMKKGKIIEQGNHKTLLAKKGTYHKLVSMQSLE
jgi:subfamily B ATP-binding cassette protein MsbA